MMTSSSSRLALVLLLTHIAATYQSAAPSPTYSPAAAPPVAGDFAAGPGPSDTYVGMDCVWLLFGAADCLTYITEGSNLTVPDKACCPEFATLVATNPLCLCGLLRKGNGFGIPIDMTRALGLPSACKVETPDPSLCNLVSANGGPAGAPGSSLDSDEIPPTGEAHPPTSVKKDKGAAAIIGHSTSSLLLGLVMAVAAFTWNMF